MVFIYFTRNGQNHGLLCYREHQHFHQTLNLTCISLPVEVRLQSAYLHSGRARTGDRWQFVPWCCFWSRLPNQMKLQSLCDMATVPRKPPLGTAEVHLCLDPFFSHCTCAPNAWWVGAFPGFGFLWLSMPSSHSHLSDSLIYLFLPKEDNNTGKDKHHICPFIT